MKLRRISPLDASPLLSPRFKVRYLLVCHGFSLCAAFSARFRVQLKGEVL